MKTDIFTAMRETKWLFEVDVDISYPGVSGFRPCPEIKIEAKPNKKQERALVKGLKLTDKYIKKMKKLGFVSECSFGSIEYNSEEYALARKKIEEAKSNGTN